MSIMVKRCCIIFLLIYYIKKFVSVRLSFCISAELNKILLLKFYDNIKFAKIMDFNIGRKKILVTAGLVKYCFKYLFAIFRNHLFINQKGNFIILNKTFRLKFFCLIFSVQHFRPTLKTIQQNKLNYERLVFNSVKTTSNK